MGSKDAPPISTWLSPEGLVVLAAAGATAAVASMPLILVPGVLAYGIVTGLRLTRWKQAKTAAIWQIEPPDPTDLAKPYLQRVNTVYALADRILGTIRDAEPGVQQMLSAPADTVRNIAPTSLRLAKKLQELDRNFMGIDMRLLSKEEADLVARIERTHDDVAKAGFSRALAQQREKVSAYQELSNRRERVEAQLTNVVLTLETVAAQVLRIKSTEEGGGSSEGARIAEALDALSIEVGAAAETVDETEMPLTNKGR